MKNFFFVTDTDSNDTFCNAYFPFTSPLKGLTEKFQSGYPDLGKTIDIFTDENAIIFVEEATGSPIRTNKYENHEKFEKVNKQKFSDEILFKKSSKGDKNSRMTQSAYTVGSGSHRNGEKDSTPLFMNSSFSGVLPDVRSLDTIKCDIEEKEKILEKMLDLDKVEIPQISRLDKITHDFETKFYTDDIATIINDDIVVKESKPKETVRKSPKSVSYIEKVVTNVDKQNVQHLASMEKKQIEKNEPLEVPCKYFCL